MAHADLEQLLDEHRRIDDRSLDIIRMAGNPKMDIPAIEAALHDLNELVMHHVDHEDVLIYDLANHLRQLGRHEQEQSMSEELAKLQGDWMRYLKAWAKGGIADDPERFRNDTNDLLQRVRGRVHIESELLYFTALRHGLILLRPAEDGTSYAVSG